MVLHLASTMSLEGSLMYWRSCPGEIQCHLSGWYDQTQSWGCCKHTAGVWLGLNYRRLHLPIRESTTAYCRLHHTKHIFYHTPETDSLRFYTNTNKFTLLQHNPLEVFIFKCMQFHFLPLSGHPADEVELTNLVQ